MSFQPSKLGTKEHWDAVYDEEVRNFDELGDEGEVWFGEDSTEKMIDWALRYVPPPRSILEIGTGNGVLLCGLAEHGYDPSRLMGVDYSPASILLSQKVAGNRGRSEITFTLCDFLQGDPPGFSGVREALNAWDVLLDKGTFDAIALAEGDFTGESPVNIYSLRVSRLLQPNGIFLITSCNFTENELIQQFATDQTGLRYHSRIRHKTYIYGGKTGSVCASVAFQKPG